MPTTDKVRFFDELSTTWDERHDLEAVAAELRAGIEALGVGPDETVLDVGCGTGNLTRILLERLSDEGRVVAVDVAPAMIERTRRKNPDVRLECHVADAASLPLPDASIDRVICCSVWPHLDDPRAAAVELTRVLRSGGRLHVWHLEPRSRINDIHAAGAAAIRNDLLGPAEETARLLAAAGLTPVEVIDDESLYLVTAALRRG